MLNTSHSARLWLILMAVIWGLTFPLIHTAIAYISPSFFIICRFSLAAIFMLPILIFKRVTWSRAIILSGIILGLLNFGAYFFQAQGMQTINASRAAFITGANVIIVPLLAPLFRLGKPQKIDYLCAAACLVGLYCLTGASLTHLQRGDIEMLLCALCVALTILTIQKLSIKNPCEISLTLSQLTFTAIFSWMLFKPIDLHINWTPSVLIGLLFCSIIATVLVFLIQIRYQKFVSTTQAAIIFSLEPVFAVLFDWLINHQTLNQLQLAGGSIILISMLLPLFTPTVLNLFSNHRIRQSI